MRCLKHNQVGSIVPVLVVIVVLGVAGFLILVMGEILEPFFNIMSDGAVKDFLLIIFPKGILLVVFFVIIFVMLMEYQKSSYREGGGR